MAMLQMLFDDYLYLFIGLLAEPPGKVLEVLQPLTLSPSPPPPLRKFLATPLDMGLIKVFSKTSILAAEYLA